MNMESYKTKNKLVVLFYMLMRDEVPVGKIEEIRRNIDKLELCDEYVLSNGYLAKYAEELVNRMK